MSSTIPPLEQANDEIKLAVDLIYLLESHDIDPKTALAALAIVQQDFQRKLNQTEQCDSENKDA